MTCANQEIWVVETPLHTFRSSKCDVMSIGQTGSCLSNWQTSCFCLSLCSCLSNWHDITLLSVPLSWHHLFIVCEFFPAFYTLFNTMAKKITKHICSTVFDSCEWLPISMDFFLTSRSNDRQYWVYTTEIIAEMTILCVYNIYILCIHAVLSYEDVCAKGRSLAHG